MEVSGGLPFQSTCDKFHFQAASLPEAHCVSLCSRAACCCSARVQIILVLL